MHSCFFLQLVWEETISPHNDIDKFDSDFVWIYRSYRRNRVKEEVKAMNKIEVDEVDGRTDNRC